jgi:hypothetical protein
VHGNSADVVSAPLAFAGMQTDANIDVDLA